MLTDDEITQVLNALKKNAKDASKLDSVTSLDGVSSLPVVESGTWKKVPLDLLKAGVGNVQGDWNENDSDAADYIKNRTHYMTIGSQQFNEDVYLVSGQCDLTDDPQIEAGTWYMMLIDNVTKVYGEAVEHGDGVAWPRQWAEGGTGWRYAIDGKTMYTETGGNEQRNVKLYPITFQQLSGAYVPDVTEQDIDNMVSN